METFHSPYEEPREPNITSSDTPYHYTRSVSSDQLSDQEETETEPINYQELIDLVYSLVPSEHCKQQPAPQVKVRSITADLAGEIVHQKYILPHSSTVRATASQLAELEAFQTLKGVCHSVPGFQTVCQLWTLQDTLERVACKANPIRFN